MADQAAAAAAAAAAAGEDQNQPPVNENVEQNADVNADADADADAAADNEAGADDNERRRQDAENLRELLRQNRLLIEMSIRPPAQRGATLDNLSSSTPEKWMSFRQHFLAVLDTKNWTVQQAKRELKAAFRDEAANCITGIEFSPNDDEVSVIAVLNLLEARFLAGRGTSRAIEDFRAATQSSTETIQAFYGRLWSLYKRAYPGGVGNADRNLVNQFKQGLKDSQVRVHQCMMNHDTLEEALQTACTAEAGVVQSQRLAGGRLNAIGDLGTPPNPQIATSGQHQTPNAQIAAFGQYQPTQRLTPLTPGACLVCSKPGHQYKDCQIHVAIQRSAHLTRGSNRGVSHPRGRFRGRGSSRGNRGRQGPRGGGRGRNFTPRPSGLHALTGEHPGLPAEPNTPNHENPLAEEDVDTGTEEGDEEDGMEDYAEYYEGNSFPSGHSFASGLE